MYKDFTTNTSQMEKRLTTKSTMRMVIDEIEAYSRPL